MATGRARSSHEPTAVSLLPSSTDTAIVRRLLHATWFATALLASACAPRPVLPRHPAGETIRVKVHEGTIESVRDVPIDDYVAGAALSELGPTVNVGMIEVQTIVARTYAESHRGRHSAEGFDLCSTTHCQLYEPDRLSGSRWTPELRDTVRRTAGLILIYDGAPADAVYHADCGGWTSAAADVWGGLPRPYLHAQRDRRDAPGGRDAHTRWQYAVDPEALRRALNADPRTRLSGRLLSIAILSRDASGRAQRVLLRADTDVSVRGTDLREVLTRTFGARSIRSTLFDVVPAGGQYLFSGSGFGHGVGLCQVGALAQLAAGETPRAVLSHYYPGTTLALHPAGRAPSLRPSSHRQPD
jgi:stage II sporulation protein D